MTEKTEKAEKAAAPAVEIIRGRMPVAIAAVVKHHIDAEMKDAEVAAMFRTTNGKVADLRADRNFAYVTADFKPTKEQVAQAVEYADQCDDGAKIKKLIKAMGVATEEEAAALDEARKATRKTPGKPKAPKKKAKSKDEAEIDAEDESEELEADDDLDDLLDD